MHAVELQPARVEAEAVQGTPAGAARALVPALWARASPQAAAHRCQLFGSQSLLLLLAGPGDSGA
jgi:hypothetical protein